MHTWTASTSYVSIRLHVVYHILRAAEHDLVFHLPSSTCRDQTRMSDMVLNVWTKPACMCARCTSVTACHACAPAAGCLTGSRVASFSVSMQQPLLHFLCCQWAVTKMLYSSHVVGRNVKWHPGYGFCFIACGRLTNKMFTVLCTGTKALPCRARELCFKSAHAVYHALVSQAALLCILDSCG